MDDSLKLTNISDKMIYLKDYNCYLLERIPYCRVQEVPAEQCMNIYIPAVYMTKEGIINSNIQFNGFDAATVPVIFENGLAGYKEAEPFSIEDERSAAKDFIKAGFVYVSCGCRGRSSINSKGIYVGKSPVSLVDLKAGIRFLKANAGIIPGDMNRIISVGISAGGAMSALLGSTGNSSNYENELEKMGAVMSQGDDIFASLCYCPITDLDHADYAYEWMFQGKYHYNGMPYVGFDEGDLSPYCRALSERMAAVYVNYFNSLNLRHPKAGQPLQITIKRGGSGAAYLKEVLEQSATKFLKKLEQKELSIKTSVNDYIHGNYQYLKYDISTKSMIQMHGIDKSRWLSWDGSRATISAIDDMLENYLTRMKMCPAFDDLNLIQAENQLFGTSEVDRMHFNTELASEMAELESEFPSETCKYFGEYDKIKGDMALAKRKYLINPLNYIGTGEKCTLAPHFRIRVGSRDADTSLTVTMILALKLMQTGKTDVDYEIVWDEPHGRADYPGEAVQWVKRISAR